MSEDQSWCLFKSHTLDNGDHNPFNEFETIGKQIVKKCNGLPLTIKTVAGALRPETDIKEWDNVLCSEIWAARFEALEHQIKELGLREIDPMEKYPYRVPSSSVVDKSQFFGRNGEKEKLIERVLSDGGASDVSVIAITGMGGIGKTTVAQLVYNDDRVKDKFQTRAWVCVSEEYDDLKVTKSLLMEVNSDVVDDKDDFNRLQVKLKENLEGKCFLIILDDIWNENSNDWSNLKTPMNYGSRGSKIIVTTRNEKVARMMQNEQFHDLHPMPEDQSWCLFKSQAFDNGDHTPFREFETIGKQIVKKCNGLPLAIKTVASALRPETDIKEWDNFLRSEIWAARFEAFANQIKELSLLKYDTKEKYPYPAPSSSLVDKSQIFGRDVEKNKLIERVLSDIGDSDVSVIAVTGMGGIGKTTLAQLAYNDDRVKNKFQTRAWVCVSEEYDDLKVTKSLLMEVNSDVVDDRDDFNRLQVKLRHSLAGKCFLIILDDIWNENSNDWSRLKTPLNYGSRGSKIVVTTRNEKVAGMMQNEPFQRLHPMAEEQSWSLFKSQALDNGDHSPLLKFEGIGKKIVKKCNGLPLAIKTIAGALRSERDINVWQDFLSSEDWVVGGDILPALSLSYKNLPSHLKVCFAFCALFHKDVPFDKDEVVLLWMANDLVKPSTQKVGLVYFEELISRSFFESVDEQVYLMHDLINDLARSLSGNTCIRLEDYQAVNCHQSIQQENLLPPELLHLSYLTHSSRDTSKKLRGLAHVQGLRTFLPIHQELYWLYAFSFSFSDMFPRFQRLRVLNLRRHDVSMVPDSIGDLKHLRFLNLASTKIKRLPIAICKCLNLQTLILSNCKELVELPEEMRLLINLQHLDVRGVGDLFIKKMATWLSIIKHIQNIYVVVDKVYGNVLQHLDKLQPCQSLYIIGLGDTNVVTTEGAKREELKDKSCIEDLTLEWGGVAESRGDEFNKFVKLQPHTNIKQLSIEGYTGSRFPNWLGDSAFTNMEFLLLKDCKNCFFLPPLGQLTGLKKLEISGMDGIREIGKEFYGDASTSKPLQALQQLKIINCNNIMSFPEGGLSAPNLKTLCVRNCSKMKSLPARMHTQLPLLTELDIEYCPEIECFPEGGLPASLETLEIWNCSKMRICQANWGLRTLPSLKKVSLNGFEDKLFPEEGLLPTSLQELRIENFSNLESLNKKGLQHLFSLRSLTIWSCLNLKCLPQQKFSSSLSEVYIRNCKLVESFPEGLASSLSYLRIGGCPKLAARIEREKGEDWPNICHIPNIEIW